MVLVITVGDDECELVLRHVVAVTAYHYSIGLLQTSNVAVI